ncbi:MAG: DUF2191 domain-containing protein [Terriglobia bacterium]
MRITIRIDDQLHAEAKKRAAEQGTTLTPLINNSLREALARWKPAHRGKRFRMMTFGRGGLRPGVDLDDSASLLGCMEGIDGAD